MLKFSWASILVLHASRSTGTSGTGDSGGGASGSGVRISMPRVRVCRDIGQ